MSTFRRLAVIGAALLFVLPAAAAAENRVVLAELDRPTPVSAYGSGLLWSQRDEAGMFRLWYSEEGSPPARLPVKGRSVPFDADLGPADDGRSLAVYSRCRVEPPMRPLTDASPPDYRRGTGCAIYELDLTSGTERRIRAASPTDSSEILPTVWQGRIAFARVYNSNRSATRLYTRPRVGGGPSRRLPGARALPGAHPTSLDLYGRRLAVAWRGGALRTSLEMIDVAGGEARVVEERSSRIALRWPSFDDGRLFYARACAGAVAGCGARSVLVRMRYALGRTKTARLGATDLWHARGHGVTYVLRDRLSSRACFDPEAEEPQATCELLLVTPTYR
jgi:hypothetical protein